MLRIIEYIKSLPDYTLARLALEIRRINNNEEIHTESKEMLALFNVNTSYDLNSISDRDLIQHVIERQIVNRFIKNSEKKIEDL